LRILDLAGSQICDKPNYREDVYAILPQIEILDGKNKAGEEIEEDQSEEEEFVEGEEESLSEGVEIPGKRKEPGAAKSESEEEEFVENEEEEEEEQSEEGKNKLRVL
jgi:hypothetical protein